MLASRAVTIAGMLHRSGSGARCTLPVLALWLAGCGGAAADASDAASVADTGVDAASVDARIDSSAVDATAGLDAGCVVPSGASEQTRQVPGFANRPYDLHVPPGYVCGTPIPLVLALHGGGGNALEMRAVTCPGGVLTDPGCLTAVADREGFAIAFANGTGYARPDVRTFNAGGGTGSYTCVSGRACQDGVDDDAYVDALLADVERVLSLDRARVYATGFSNGAALTHRLACTHADRFAAIASVAGGNQFSTSSTCSPTREVSVLEFHGTADPCWPYAGGVGSCAEGGDKIAVDASMVGTASAPGWAMRDGCDTTPTSEALPDLVSDGTTVTRLTYPSCASGASVVVYRIEGGGHRWPGGELTTSPLGNDTGPLTRDINASEEIWAFFRAHTL